MKKTALILLFAALCAWGAAAQPIIAAKDAPLYYGKTVTIFDKVYNTQLNEGTSAVLLYLGKNYPDHYLTVVIKPNDRTKFTVEEPELYFKWMRVVVKGTVMKVNDKPVIYATEAGQLKQNHGPDKKPDH